LPNLLVPGIADALAHSRGLRVYVCNLATQPGETDNYNVADHVAVVAQYIPIECLDVVLANDNLSVPPNRGGGKTIYVQPVAPPHVRLVTADLVDEQRPWRHDSVKVAEAVVALLERTEVNHHWF
jgi:uncharacterized cofD-like protein